MNTQRSLKAMSRRSERSFGRPAGGKLTIVVIIIVLTTLAFATVFPVYFTLISSLKDQAAWSASKFALPIPPNFENFTTAWRRANVPRTFMNSLVTTIGSVVLCFFSCTV